MVLLVASASCWQWSFSAVACSKSAVSLESCSSRDCGQRVQKWVLGQSRYIISNLLRFLRKTVRATVGFHYCATRRKILLCSLCVLFFLIIKKYKPALRTRNTRRARRTLKTLQIITSVKRFWAWLLCDVRAGSKTSNFKRFCKKTPVERFSRLLEYC